MAMDLRSGEGGELSIFDQGYLDKARVAYETEILSKGETLDDNGKNAPWNDPVSSGRSIGGRSSISNASPYPKLRPPRFVSREQVSLIKTVIAAVL